MKAIVAVDKNWGIGSNGGLLAHLPGDLNYFKEKTMGKIMVMGRRTLESLPGGKPLPGRINIVLTKDLNFQGGCATCNSLEDLFEELKKYPEDDVFVVGGADVYKQLLIHCDTYYVTKIDEIFPADCHLENLDENENFSVNWESAIHKENEIEYKFVEYRRK